MKQIETMIQNAVIYSRWLLVVFHVGLGIGLAVFGAAFLYKLLKLATGAIGMDPGDLLLAMLGLIDSVLVANLIVMVMISSYENYVSSLCSTAFHDNIAWMGKLDAGTLKIKLATAIGAISSIHLLQMSMNLEHYAGTEVFWAVIIQLVFIVTAVLLGLLEKLTGHH
ncbi:conserved membrane hypothetical protein [uncultured Gammaproteobacteria bacterium]